MKVITKGRLTQLTRFGMNCYIWEEDDYLTLIDTTLKINASKIIEYLKNQTKPLKYLILTHYHSDHVGGVQKIKQDFPQSQIVMAKVENDSLSANQKKLPFEINCLVDDGAYLGTLQVIFTKGHTDDSLSLYNLETEMLLVGDALQVNGGFRIAGDMSIRFPLVALATEDKHEALVSARRFLSLSIQMLGSGHGKMIEYPHDKIVIAVERVQNKLN